MVWTNSRWSGKCCMTFWQTADRYVCMHLPEPPVLAISASCDNNLSVPHARSKQRVSWTSYNLPMKWDRPPISRQDFLFLIKLSGVAHAQLDVQCIANFDCVPVWFFLQSRRDHMPELTQTCQFIGVCEEQVMQRCKPGVMEYQLESTFLSYCYSEVRCSFRPDLPCCLPV